MEILLEHDTNMESIVSQLQKGTSNRILCVKNGFKLLVFSLNYTLPKSLKYIETITNALTSTTEYHYRDIVTDDLYVFFIEFNSLVRNDRISIENEIIDYKGICIHSDTDAKQNENVEKIIVLS